MPRIHRVHRIYHMCDRIIEVLFNIDFVLKLDLKFKVAFKLKVNLA